MNIYYVIHNDTTSMKFPLTKSKTSISDQSDFKHSQ